MQLPVGVQTKLRQVIFDRLQKKGLTFIWFIYYNVYKESRVVFCENRKNLFCQCFTQYSDKKNIMPAKGFIKPFVGINLLKNRKHRKKSAEKICVEVGIPLGTVKVWINRYKKEHDISQQVLKDDVAFSESELIKIEKKYKTQEKTLRADNGASHKPA